MDLLPPGLVVGPVDTDGLNYRASYGVTASTPLRKASSTYYVKGSNRLSHMLLGACLVTAGRNGQAITAARLGN